MPNSTQTTQISDNCNHSQQDTILTNPIEALSKITLAGQDIATLSREYIQQLNSLIWTIHGMANTDKATHSIISDLTNIAELLTMLINSDIDDKLVEFEQVRNACRDYYKANPTANNQSNLQSTPATDIADTGDDTADTGDFLSDWYKEQYQDHLTEQSRQTKEMETLFCQIMQASTDGDDATVQLLVSLGADLTNYHHDKAESKLTQLISKKSTNSTQGAE